MNNNLRLFEDCIKLCTCDPQILESYLEMYGVKVTILIPRKDSNDVNYYQKAFGNYSLDNTPEYYDRAPSHMLLHNLDFNRVENGFDTDCLIYYPYELKETCLVEMEFMDKIYTFNIVPNSVEVYNKLIYKLNLKLSKVNSL